MVVVELAFGAALRADPDVITGVTGDLPPEVCVMKDDASNHEKRP